MNYFIITIHFLESWNALHNRYANKNFFYSHSSMLCRAALAAIDNNSNLERQQVIQPCQTGSRDSYNYKIFHRREINKDFLHLARLATELGLSGEY